MSRMSNRVVQSSEAWLRTESVEAGTLAAGRRYQEDGFAGNDAIWAVADGMGGHRAGDLAARAALETLCALISEPVDAETVHKAFVAANDVVLALAEPGEARPPGSTLVAAIRREGGGLHIASTGDSRAYLIHPDDTWELITDDHEDAFGGLTAYLGDSRSEGVHVDSRDFPAGRGLRVLLCTDGFFGHVEHETLEELLPQGFEEMLTKLAETSRDNVTAVLIDVDGFCAGTSRTP